MIPSAWLDPCLMEHSARWGDINLQSVSSISIKVNNKLLFSQGPAQLRFEIGMRGSQGVPKAIIDGICTNYLMALRSELEVGPLASIKLKER